MVITDKLIEDGQATEKEFQDLYGTDHVTFISGDLTKQDETEGKGLEYLTNISLDKMAAI